MVTRGEEHISRVNHAPSQKVGPQRHPKFLGPTYAHSIRNSDQILYGDQTRYEENFYMIDHAFALAEIFGDTNADVRLRSVYHLPDSIVMVDTVNQFKNRLDKYWKNYDFVYDHRATYTGTGGRF